MSLSLAWLHFVERWPRMQGSQAIFCPLMSGMASDESAAASRTTALSVLCGLAGVLVLAAQIKRAIPSAV